MWRNRLKLLGALILGMAIGSLLTPRGGGLATQSARARNSPGAVAPAAETTGATKARIEGGVQVEEQGQGFLAGQEPPALSAAAMPSNEVRAPVVTRARKGADLAGSINGMGWQAKLIGGEGGGVVVGQQNKLAMIQREEEVPRQHEHQEGQEQEVSRRQEQQQREEPPPIPLQELDTPQQLAARNLTAAVRQGHQQASLQRRRGGPIRRVALVAERHSGSTWLTKVMTEYWKGSGVTVSASLCDWKHWFQDRVHASVASGERRCVNDCASCKDPEHTLVIVLWRNPYDWLSSMHKYAWHAADHQNMANFGNFLTKEWAPQEGSRRQAAFASLKGKAKGQQCLDNFLPGEVLPCKPNHRQAIYELDSNGGIYPHLYSLRLDKIRDWASIAEWAPNYESVQYERFLREGPGGVMAWLKELDTRHGISRKGKGVPAPIAGKAGEALKERKRGSVYLTNGGSCHQDCKYRQEGGRPLELVNEMFDARLEGSIGYEKLHELL